MGAEGYKIKLYTSQSLEVVELLKEQNSFKQLQFFF